MHEDSVFTHWFSHDKVDWDFHPQPEVLADIPCPSCGADVTALGLSALASKSFIALLLLMLDILPLLSKLSKCFQDQDGDVSVIFLGVFKRRCEDTVMLSISSIYAIYLSMTETDLDTERHRDNETMRKRAQ